MSSDHTAQRLADAVGRHYGREVASIVRVPRGLGTTNWRVSTRGGEYFLKQYAPDDDLRGEAMALALSQTASAAGVPAPLVIQALSGERLHVDGDLAFALFEYLPDTTSGVALTLAQMAEAGRTLGVLHHCLRGIPPGLPDISGEWLTFDGPRKKAELERYLAVIASRHERDEFDERTVPLLQSRVARLPQVGAMLASLPVLTKQVVHGDYSIWNILFRGAKLVGVVDFRPPEPFLPAFEIGRAALNPETVTAGPWMEKAVAFVEEYCRANPAIDLSDVRFAPHVWATQLVRSEYGVRQHYFRPLEYQADLDRFWFQRCETAEVILDNLEAVSSAFAAAWDGRNR